MKSSPMLVIGGADKEKMREATAALVAIIKAAGTEAAVIASVNALVALCKGPENVSLSGCTFDASTARRAS